MARGCRDLSVALSPLGNRLAPGTLSSCSICTVTSCPAVDDGPKISWRRASPSPSAASATASRTSSPRPTATGTSACSGSDILPHVARFNQALVESRHPADRPAGLRDPGLRSRPLSPGIRNWARTAISATAIRSPCSSSPGDPRRYPVRRRRLSSTWIKERGMTPIAAQPGAIQALPGSSRGKLRYIEPTEGAWLQLTVDSFLGNHGGHARRSCPPEIDRPLFERS